MSKLDSFLSKLDDNQPDSKLSIPLQALWWSRKGEWHKAHALVQSGESSEADWVHGYLHRVEGDDSNAAYWYSVSNQPKPNGTLEEEWLAIVESLLGER